MRTIQSGILAILAFSLVLGEQAWAQQGGFSPSPAQGGSIQGGSIQGGSIQGGSIQGGSAQGRSAAGGPTQYGPSLGGPSGAPSNYGGFDGGGFTPVTPAAGRGDELPEPSSGWKFPNLNPFRSKQSASRGMAELNDSPPRSGWKFPSIPKPSLPSFRRSESTAMDDYPSAAGPKFQPLKKLNQGARGFFTTAKNTITRPFTREERPPTTVPNTRSGPRGSFFNRQPEEGDPAAETARRDVSNANDFLKLPRPGTR